MNIPALKEALRVYSAGPQTMNPAECVYRHTYPNGFQEHISYEKAAEAALIRILALEKELLEIFEDPWIRDYRNAKREKA